MIRSQRPAGLPRREAAAIALTGLAALVVTAAPALKGLLPAEAPSRVAPYTLGLERDNGLDARIALFRSRAAADPGGFSDLNELAALYVAKAKASGDYGYYVLAERAADQSLHTMPTDNPAAWMALAQVAMARHDFTGAIRLGQQAARFRRRAAEPLFVTAYLALGEVARAAAIAETLPEREPGLESSMLRAQVRMAQGHDAEAIADLKHGLTHEQVGQLEASSLARVWLAQAYARLGDEEAATDAAREALRIQPASALALAEMARLDARAGRPAEGARRLHDAYEHGQGAAYLAAAARLEALAGDAAGARRDADAAEAQLRRELADGGFGHRRDLARLLLASARPGAAAEALRLMRADVGIRHDPETLKTLAWAQAANGRWAEARASLERARAAGTHDAEFWALAAAADGHLGRAGAARADSEKAWRLDPRLTHDPAWPGLAALGVTPAEAAR